jgi:ABC-type transport system substrate-binding protein
MVVPDLREQYGDYPAQPDGGSPNESGMGYFDQLLVHDGVNPLSPFVAESFAFNSDGDELTLNIRKGIKFNTPDVFAGSDYGELTAHDVVWNMNRQNTRSNPDFKPGLDEELGDTFGIAVAFDDYTVKVPPVWPNFLFLPISEFAFGGVTVRLASKNAYETEGAEAVKLVPVGSGPFTIGEWRPDDRGTVHAIPNHWAETSQISSFTVFQVPDMVTRIAALQTMQADLSEIDFARIGELEGMGLKFMQTMTDADTMTLGTIWPGNLWTDLNARTGEALEPWKSSVYEKDYPWIGCPWADRCPYDDRNNPQGMSDMEQARLVRWALSMTIDKAGHSGRVAGRAWYTYLSGTDGAKVPRLAARPNGHQVVDRYQH